VPHERYPRKVAKSVNRRTEVPRTPERFIFDIKAFRLSTEHPTSASALPADIRKSLGPAAKDKLYDTDISPELHTELVRRSTDALAPLQAAGKLAAILLQFPPWMIYRPSNLEGVLRCAESLQPFPVAVEFRQRSWFDEKHRAAVLAALQEYGATWTTRCALLAGLYRFAMARCHVKASALPDRRPKLPPQQTPYVYSSEELQRLLDATGILETPLTHLQAQTTVRCC
jgi:uncharacterized protein YecE (DUF72 family)